MLLTLQCCGQDTDGLYKAMEEAIARSEVIVSQYEPFVCFFGLQFCFNHTAAYRNILINSWHHHFRFFFLDHDHDSCFGFTMPFQWKIKRS